MKAVVFNVICWRATFNAIAIHLEDGVSKNRLDFLREVGEGDVLLSLRCGPDEKVWTSEQDPERWMIGAGAGGPEVRFFATGMRGLHQCLAANFGCVVDGDVVNLTDYASGRTP